MTHDPNTRGKAQSCAGKRVNMPTTRPRPDIIPGGCPGCEAHLELHPDSVTIRHEGACAVLAGDDAARIASDFTASQLLAEHHGVHREAVVLVMPTAER